MTFFLSFVIYAMKYPSVPAGAFCDASSISETTKHALAEMETRMRAEFEIQRAKNGDVYAKQLEASRAKNRKEYAKLIEASRAKSRVDFETSRKTNKEMITALRRDVKKLQKGRDANRQTIDSFIYLTRFRENIRMVEMFFNELYKEWVKTEWSSKLYTDGWRHNMQLRLDYNEYPDPSDTSFTSRKDRLAAHARDKNLMDEARNRRARATAFLRAMWVGFGGKSEITLNTWLDLVHFVKQTNDASHASTSWGSAKHASNVVEEQRSKPPRVNTISAGNTASKLLVMLDVFGGKKWNHASSKECAIENRGLFPNFPEAWPSRQA